jgi:hypothetical protein
MNSWRHFWYGNGIQPSQIADPETNAPYEYHVQANFDIRTLCGIYQCR